MKKYKLGIFIFTRDLRLDDNSTLIFALSECETIIPIFIFNPHQIDTTNKYKSDSCVQFMCECLDELNESLNAKKSRLFYFYDYPEKVIGLLLKKYKDILAVYMNKDYTPFAVERENSIKKICDTQMVHFVALEDHVLNGVDDIKNGSGDAYVKFTPFMRTAKKKKISIPVKNTYTNYATKSKKLDGEYKKDIHKFYTKNPNVIVAGGRSNAINIFKNIKSFADYNTERDYPSVNTTLLSPYLKFNVVSVREIYHYIKKNLPKNTKLITQLYWRDFYMSITYHHPHVIGNNMKENYVIKWKNDTKLINKWRNGQTGFPLVDAGMRQLNTISWMHNRVRMVVANFLIKILQSDWRIGEQYFAQKLIDYDPANNNGGWQWCASTGTDSQPYFRYLNPWLQSKKFDKDCEYIKKWIPELQDVDTKDIHKWNITYKKYPNIKYPKPIVDNVTKIVKNTIKMYQ